MTLVDYRTLPPPIHKPPRLHESALLMSFDNQWIIRNAYQEIIGLNGVDHFSINIVSPRGEMAIISYSPSIIYQIFRDGTYLYNGSISPTYYEHLDFYTWDQCYDRRYFSQVKHSLQTKNGIDTGIVLVQRVLGFNILFSFAAKHRNNELLTRAAENSQQYIEMGFHCLDRIKNTYSQYYECNDLFALKKPSIIKPVCRLPHLTSIK